METKQTGMRRLHRILLIFLLAAAGLLLPWFYITQPVMVSPVQSANPVSANSLKQYVVKLASEFGIRDHSNPGKLLQVAKYIRSRLQGSTDRIRLQAYRVQNETYYNVVASYGPKNGKRIVVGAHYDTVDTTPGADDNASGVAGLIAIGRLLGKTAGLKTRIDLVAYTLEEPPYFDTEDMGSYIHARRMKQQQVNIRLMVALESIGFYSAKPGSQQFPIGLLKYFYSDRGNFVAVVGKFGHAWIIRQFKKKLMRHLSLPVYSITAPAFLPGINLSDHLNYWKFDFPAIMVTDTAFFRNDRYHTESDTPETLDYERMAKVVYAVYRGIVDLANDN